MKVIPMIEASLFGIIAPCALSLGFLAGMATVSALNRDERRRLRYLTRYVQHVEHEIERHHMPDLPPMVLIPRPAYDNARRPVLVARH